MANSYYKQDIEYIVLQESSLQTLVNVINKTIVTFNNRDTEDDERELTIRVEGGIMREDVIGTYTQVLVKSEFIERPGWL